MDGFRPVEHVRSSKAAPFPGRSHDDGEDVCFFLGEEFPLEAGGWLCEALLLVLQLASSGQGQDGLLDKRSRCSKIDCF